MTLEPGYRREPLPDPESVGEGEVLVQAIRDEIRRDGPIDVRTVHGPRPLRARARVLPAARGEDRVAPATS